MFNTLLQQYDAAKQAAASRGIPVSREDVLRSLYPAFASLAEGSNRAASNELAAKKLAQEKYLFDKSMKQQGNMFNVEMAANKRAMDRARPVNYANIALSGLNTLGTGIYMNRQEDEMRKRLALLNQMYGGAK